MPLLVNDNLRDMIGNFAHKTVKNRFSDKILRCFYHYWLLKVNFVNPLKTIDIENAYGGKASSILPEK